MPTNLPAKTKHKWNQVVFARTPKEKLEALQEFLSMVPKHKGTARLCAQVKRQIATLRREIESKKQRKTSRKTSTFFIEKEGAAQIVILGPPNVGKSSLLASLTNAKVTITEYPFSTRNPVPGMFQYEDLFFQLVEAPSLVYTASRGGSSNLQTLGLCRNADGLILMVDLTQDPCEQLKFILNELDKAGINVQKRDVRVEIKEKHRGTGLRVILYGKLNGCTLRDVEQLLRSYKILDCVVKIYGDATLDDIEDAIFGGTVDRPAIVIANKIDSQGTRKKFNELEVFVKDSMRLIPISCKRGVDKEKLGGEIFQLLNIIRVYTKEPNEKVPSSEPFILKKGSAVLDLSKRIHSDFYRKLHYAKVWAGRLPFSPRKVGSYFILEDSDIVETHIK